MSAGAVVGSGVGGTGVAVGGTGVAVGGTGVGVGGTGVGVGGTGVAVGGTGVAVGGTRVGVGSGEEHAVTTMTIVATSTANMMLIRAGLVVVVGFMSRPRAVVSTSIR